MYEKYTTGDTDFSKQLKIIKKSGVKSVLLPGETADSLNIIAQAEEMGLDVTFLGDMSWGEETFQKSLNDLSVPIDPEHLAFVQFFATDSDDDSKKVSDIRERFLEAYHEKYGSDQEPDEAVALGFDAYLLAVDAIVTASGDSGRIADGTAIRDVMLDEDYSFDGASGVIRFNQNGDPKKTAYISTWQNGTINAIYTIDAKDQ